jgi:hypothetical protein
MLKWRNRTRAAKRAPLTPKVEALEQRRLLSASPVFAPHAKVEGQSLQDWAADWWKKTFSIPVYASDGHTIIHPQFDGPVLPGDIFNAANVDYAQPSQNGKVTFLFGSFFGGTLDRTVTVPSDKPIFLPTVNDIWSNPDTADPPTFSTFPGHYSKKELAEFAVEQTDTITGLKATLDGSDIPNITSHREPSLKFKLKESGPYSFHNVFFGGDAPKGAFPAAADGYYLMLKPLAPGDHVLRFQGSSPDNSGKPPLLGAFSLDMTYHIKVVAPSKHGHGCDHANVRHATPVFNTTRKIADDVLV